MTNVYEVRGMSIRLYTNQGTVEPVSDVSYSVRAGECLAIVGESGSGKTVMNLAPLGLMPAGVTVDLLGSVKLNGREIIGLGNADLDRIRGREVCTIFQDPMSALNPARRIGRQLAEVCERHLGLSSRQAEDRAVELMTLTGISDARARFRQYPHELSGGLCQRVMIAMAVATEPKILIADEPTTALDVTVQAQILALLNDLRRRLGMAMVLVTHDIGVVAGSADRVAVMYAGRLVEQGPVEQVLTAPNHPYTKALIEAIPRPTDPIGSRFRGLSGMPPQLTKPIVGCAFAPRCPERVPICTVQRPVLRAADARSTVACHLAREEESAA